MFDYEDNEVELINEYEGATFQERYDNAKIETPDLIDFVVATRFNDNLNIKKTNSDKELVESYYGSTPQKKYNLAKEDEPSLSPFSDLYPAVGKAKGYDIEEPKYKIETLQSVARTEADNKYAPNLYDVVQYEENVDNATTVSKPPKPEMTGLQRFDQYSKISEMEFVESMNREQLLEAGIDEDVIDMLERNEVITPPDAGNVALDPLGFVAENAVGTGIMSLLGKMGVPNILNPIIDEVKQWGLPRKIVNALEGGSTEELKRYIKTIEGLKGMKLGDEIFTGGGSLSNNIFFQRAYYEKILGGVKSKIRGGINKAFPNSFELADDMKKVFVGMEKVAYKETQDKYQAVEDVASNLTYPVKQMKEDILNELKERGVPSEVYSEVKRNLEYIGRNLTPVQDAASRQLTGVTTKLTNLSAKTTTQKNILASTEKKLAKAQQQDAKYQKQLADPKSDPLDMDDVLANKKLISELTDEAKTQKGIVGKMSRNKDTLLKQKEGLQAQLPDTDYVSEKEFMRMIKRLNEKTRTGGQLSTSDKQVTSSLQLAKKRVQEGFESATKEHNPGVYDKFMGAQKTYKEYAEVFGKKEDIGGVINSSTLEETFETIMRSPEKVAKFTRLLKQKDPDLAKDFANKYLTKEIGAVKEGSRDLFDSKGIDLLSISGKLDNMINNPETKKFIIDNIGQAKFDEIENLFNVTSGIKGVMDKIGYTGKLNEGFMQYFKDADGALNKTGRVMRYVVDSVRRLGSDIGVVKQTLAEKVGANDGKIMKSLMQSAGPRLKKLLSQPYSADWTTGKLEQSTALMDKAIKLINNKLEGNLDDKGQQLFQKNITAVYDEFAKENDLHNKANKELASTLIKAGLSPILVMKTLGVGKVALAGSMADRGINRQSRANKLKQSKDPNIKTYNPLGIFKDLFN